MIVKSWSVPEIMVCSRNHGLLQKSWSVPEIRNYIDNIKSETIWVKHCPKREAFFKLQDRVYIHQVDKLVENIDGCEHFSLAHPFLVKIFEVTFYVSSDFPLYSDGWSSEDKQNVLAYLKKLESLEFVYSMVILSRSLLCLKEAVVKLQGKNKDIVSGYPLSCSAVKS